jgi:transposase
VLPARWELRTIRASLPELAGYTLSGIWRLLWRSKLGLHSPQVQLYSPDPEYQAKLDRLSSCLRQAAAQPDRIAFLFLDEMGYYRWPEPAPDWGPASLATREGTNRQQRIIGALDALSGRVHYQDNYIVGRERVIAFYHQLDAAYPAAETLYVAQDNWSIHSHPEVLAALEGLPRIRPVWLPTYAPWLNPIEKLWRWLREAVLKLHRLAGDWKALRQRVNAFLDQFAAGSPELLHYVGLQGEGKLATCVRVA